MKHSYAACAILLCLEGNVARPVLVGCEINWQTHLSFTKDLLTKIYPDHALKQAFHRGRPFEPLSPLSSGTRDTQHGSSRR